MRLLWSKGRGSHKIYPPARRLRHDGYPEKHPVLDGFAKQVSSTAETQHQKRCLGLERSRGLDGVAVASNIVESRLKRERELSVGSA